jgi:hypothetical protein
MKMVQSTPSSEKSPFWHQISGNRYRSLYEPNLMQDAQKGLCLTRPTPARQDVPFPGAAAAAGNTAGVPLGYVEDVGRAENEAREGARLGALRAGWVE